MKGLHEESGPRKKLPLGVAAAPRPKELRRRTGKAAIPEPNRAMPVPESPEELPRGRDGATRAGGAVRAALVAAQAPGTAPRYGRSSGRGAAPTGGEM